MTADRISDRMLSDHHSLSDATTSAADTAGGDGADVDINNWCVRGSSFGDHIISIDSDDFPNRDT
ncbi:MAG: hypothetical protein A2486_05980 [Burkholderiales bacterium RIFOXYC12_FULL_65_23]|nr:MAG: hypothetical protein A2486_05980 [Burkholderiales bacterium RIFOXYC12_FULL_65_23]